ncbi:MAG: ribbon-helix-helix domain-containing protein [Cellulomonadaceae bacterium]|jgi:hypothetical protein|nr:ribbon-helix-helix domain-containing protein [Cellulomonadaceae bacterium]
MSTYTTASGATYSDADLEQWGAQAEAGFVGWKFGKPSPGRPVSVGPDARPLSIRMDATRRAKVESLAAARQITPSQLVRELIDAA